MTKLLFLAALASLSACKKSDGDKAPAVDKAAPAAAADPADVADVDCEKMTTHNVEILMKDALAGKSDAEKKTTMDAVTAQHATMVKACDDEKGTKKLTHKQYDCIMAAQSTAEFTACMPVPVPAPAP